MMKKILDSIVAWIQNVVLGSIGSKKTIVAACATVFFIPFSPAYSFGIIVVWMVCQTWLDKTRIGIGKKQ